MLSRLRSCVRRAFSPLNTAAAAQVVYEATEFAGMFDMVVSIFSHFLFASTGMGNFLWRTGGVALFFRVGCCSWRAPRFYYRFVVFVFSCAARGFERVRLYGASRSGSFRPVILSRPGVCLFGGVS